MKSIQDLKYGHAMCPHCRQYFDATTSKGYFSFLHPEVPDRIFIFLCQKCQSKAEGSDASQAKTIQKRCLNNIFSEPEPIWSVTGELALRINRWDLAAAIEFGHGLPKVIYMAVINGEIDLSSFPDIHTSFADGGEA